MPILTIALLAVAAILVVPWIIYRRVIWGAGVAIMVAWAVHSFGWAPVWLPVIVTIIGLAGVVFALLSRRAIAGRVLTAAAVAGLVALVVPAAFSLNIDTPAQASSVSADELKASLTVGDQDLLPKTALCASDEFLWNSMPARADGSPSGRTTDFQDAVTIPFTSKDNEGMMKEIRTENCGNPTFLDMNLQAWSKISIDGITVGELNPWMAEFHEKAQNPGLRTAVLTKKNGVEGIFVTEEYQVVAAKANTLLNNFKQVGIVTQPSLTNYHLATAGLVAGEVPLTTLNDKQENLPLFRLELNLKDNGCVFAGGYNLLDKRWETIACEKPAPPKEVPPTKVTPPGTVPPVNPPPVKPPPVTPPPINPPPTLEPKNPSLDPSQQGNAPDGGGQNIDQGPGTYVPPKDMTPPPAAPREDPAPPAAPKPSAPPVKPVEPPVPPKEPTVTHPPEGNKGDPGGF